MARAAQTASGVPILYQQGALIFCPECAPDEAVGSSWIYGEEHEVCSACSSFLWPSRTAGSYGMLARETASLWDRFGTRAGESRYRAFAMAARSGTPLGGSQIQSVVAGLEGALLASREPQEGRWLRVLWYEARRAARWLPRPLLLTTKATPTLEAEPVVILARPPKGGTMRVTIHPMTAQDLGISLH